MRKIDIIFNMKSLDNETQYKVIGEYKNERLIFVYPDGDSNYIVLKKDGIEYYKKGESNLKFLFILNQITKGTYAVSGNTFEFRIHTKLLEYSTEKIAINYDLYQGEDLINSNTLNINYHNI